jgi:hypothetical protein
LNAGDYWDDAGRWTRNQLRRITEHRKRAHKSAIWLGVWGQHAPLPDSGFFVTDDCVAERNVVAFAGWAGANERFANEIRQARRSILHCCTGKCSVY